MMPFVEYLRQSRRKACLPFRASVVAALVQMLACGAIMAQEAPSAFYKGKTIRIIVGFSPGGGYDTYARLFGRYLARHIPGAPSVVVENMPGAGSLKAMSYLAVGAPADGTVMGTFNSGLITQSLTAPDRVPLDFRTYAWIGNAGEDVRVCYTWGATGIQNWQDLMKRDIVHFGATSPGTAGYIESGLLRDLFGVKLRQVQGYTGSNDKRLAVERGELDGDCGGWTSLPEDWVRDRKINTVVRFSQTALPGLDMSIPYAGDLLKDESDRMTFDFLMAPEKLGRLVAMSGKVPAERVEAMRSAFNGVISDPDFLADARRQNLLITTMTGAEVAHSIAQLYSVPANVLARAKSLAGN